MCIVNKQKIIYSLTLSFILILWTLYEVQTLTLMGIKVHNLDNLKNDIDFIYSNIISFTLIFISLFLIFKAECIFHRKIRYFNRIIMFLFSLIYIILNMFETVYYSSLFQVVFVFGGFSSLISIVINIILSRYKDNK